MANRDTAKNWFKRGLKPLESQFSQLFDWIRFKDEGIAIADVNNLQSVLNAKSDTETVNIISSVAFPEIQNKTANFSYPVSGGRELEKVRFKSNSDLTIRVGLSASGDELFGDLLYPADQWHTLTFLDFSDSDRLIYFSGITAPTQFYFYKR